MTAVAPLRIAAIIPVGTAEGAKTRLGETLDAEERHDLVEIRHRRGEMEGDLAVLARHCLVEGGLALGDVGKRNVAFASAGSNAGGTKTLSAYAADFAGDIGGKASAAKTRSETAAALSTEAESRRTSAQGVNMDEELVNMTTFQQAYNASARLIQASKDMYDVLIGILQ